MEIPGSSSLGHTKLFAGLQRLGLSEGYFVIFDRRSQAPEWALRMRTEVAQTASSMAVLVLVLIGLSARLCLCQVSTNDLSVRQVTVN